MIKSLFIAVWACIVMIGASYGLTNYMKSRANAPSPVETTASETRKTKEINVPIIRDGGVKGYVVVQLNYVVDLEAAKSLPAPPEAFVIDETFQYIYGDEKIDFAHLDKLDLGKMIRAVTLRVNQRVKNDVITDMGVVECNFMLNAEAKPKLGG